MIVIRTASITLTALIVMGAETEIMTFTAATEQTIFATEGSIGVSGQVNRE